MTTWDSREVHLPPSQTHTHANIDAAGRKPPVSRHAMSPFHQSCCLLDGKVELYHPGDDQVGFKTTRAESETRSSEVTTAMMSCMLTDTDDRMDATDMSRFAHCLSHIVALYHPPTSLILHCCFQRISFVVLAFFYFCSAQRQRSEPPSEPHEKPLPHEYCSTQTCLANSHFFSSSDSSINKQPGGFHPHK